LYVYICTFFNISVLQRLSSQPKNIAALNFTFYFLTDTNGSLICRNM